MPTYRVALANLTLKSDQRSRLAEAITLAHHQCTGAPGYFAQVIFEQVETEAHFIGGRPNTATHVFVHGLIRGGRDAKTKHDLMARIAGEATAITGVGAEDVWVYLQDLEATQMIEFGRFLPAPGEEREWTENLTREKRAALEAMGVAV